MNSILCKNLYNVVVNEGDLSMLAMLKRFFVKRKKEALKKKKPANHVAILPATPAVHKQNEDFELESISTVPFWFAEHGDFTNVQLTYPPEGLIVPSINADVRASLKRYLSDVCPKPDGSMQIYAKLNEPNATIKEISALVSSDPLLAAQVLKLVNSAAFGMADEITSIGRAVTLLGFRNVKSVVLNHSIRQTVSDVHDELSIRIREHSHMSSSIAFHLSETVAGVDPFTVATMALLHDMGKILYPMLVEKGRGITFNTKIPAQVVESLVASILLIFGSYLLRLFKLSNFCTTPVSILLIQFQKSTVQL